MLAKQTRLCLGFLKHTALEGTLACHTEWSLVYCISVPFLIHILILIHRMMVTGTSCVRKFQMGRREKKKKTKNLASLIHST